MKRSHIIAAFLAGLIAAGGIAFATPARTNDHENSTMTRACILETGAPVRMQCQTGADADSGAMDALSVFRVDCDTDAWWLAGTAAVNAVANSTKIRAGVPEYFATDNSILYFSCLSVTTNGDCRISKCR